MFSGKGPKNPMLRTVGDLKRTLESIPDHLPIESCSSTGRWDGCDNGFIYVPDEKLCFMGIDDWAFNSDLDGHPYLQDLIK